MREAKIQNHRSHSYHSMVNKRSIGSWGSMSSMFAVSNIRNPISDLISKNIKTKKSSLDTTQSAADQFHNGQVVELGVFRGDARVFVNNGVVVA